jgi:phosphatidylglycerophosphatase A
MTTRLPDTRFLLSHPAHFIALGFGSGLARRAPGTFGTLAAVPLYAALALVLPPLIIALLAIPAFVLGIWASEVTARHLGIKDPSCVVWDEIAAFLPLLALTHGSWVLQLLAFALFRLFDIWKPYPIGMVDQHVSGGFGIMLDDAIAGLYAYMVLIPIFLIGLPL